MLDTINRLWKSKTFWLALAAIVTAVGSYIGGELTLEGLIIAIFGALGGATIRDGIAKSEVAANVSTEMKLFAAPDIWGSWAGRQLISLIRAKVAPGLVSKAFGAVLHLANEYGGQNASDELRRQLQTRALSILREHKLIRVYSTTTKTLILMPFLIFLTSCSVFDFDQGKYSFTWNPGGLNLEVGEPVERVKVSITGDRIVYDELDGCTYDDGTSDGFQVVVQCERETVETNWFIELACVNCSALATMYAAGTDELIYLDAQ